MVVDTAATRPALLLGIRQAGDVAVVVVTPHQRGRRRHPQAVLINLQHLLVGQEDLRHLAHILRDIAPQQLLLRVDDSLQTVGLLLHGADTFHRAIVDAPHADGEQLVFRLQLLQALRPVVEHGLPVGDEVIRSPLLDIPLADVVAQHGFTVRAAQRDAAAVGHLTGSRHLEEGFRPLVHGRPQSIAAQAQQQLEDLAVRAGSDDALLARLVGLAAPRPQTPVFVVDEDTAVFDRRLLDSCERLIQSETRLPFRHDVAPPYPRRHTGHARQLQDAVGRTASAVADHVYLSLPDEDAEAVVARVLLAYHDVTLALGHGHQSRHLPHIVTEHAQGHLYHRVGMSLHGIGDGMATVEPHFLGGLDADGKHAHPQEQQEAIAGVSLHHAAKIPILIYTRRVFLYH